MGLLCGLFVLCAIRRWRSACRRAATLRWLTLSPAARRFPCSAAFMQSTSLLIGKRIKLPLPLNTPLLPLSLIQLPLLLEALAALLNLLLSLH